MNKISMLINLQIKCLENVVADIFTCHSDNSEIYLLF